MRRTTLLAALGAVIGLSACVDDTGDMGSTAMPGAAEQACLRDVSRETGNGDVTLLGSEFSQAGTSVRVGVGPTRAPWSCTAYADGTTAGIESLTDEGFL